MQEHLKEKQWRNTTNTPEECEVAVLCVCSTFLAWFLYSLPLLRIQLVVPLVFLLVLISYLTLLGSAPGIPGQEAKRGKEF